MPPIGPRLMLLALAGLLATAGGCVRGCTSPRPPIHLNPNMDYQEKLEPQEESGFFYDGVGMRRPVEGTVARGEANAGPALRTGKDSSGAFLSVSPVQVTTERLEQGARQYSIYCAPCHTERGDGRGILFERAGVVTTSIHDPRILAYPDGQLFDVITNGVGLMPGYRYPIRADDRWAIVAWVRELQRQEQEEGR